MSRFATQLLEWYAENKRSLPWRGHPDPYAIWVSEIMLQQTRVEAVVPYFQRWMERFPTLAELARSPERGVFRAWEGLGYYARARNLRKAAQMLLEENRGMLPRSVEGLRMLPGIGRYTAGAIASIAFGLDEAALDGNIRRVLSRTFDVSTPADSPDGISKLWKLAEKHLPKGHAGDYNQAIMDLGATVCIPTNPHCRECPINNLCKARKLGIQAKRPVLKGKKVGPHHILAAGVIIKRGRVLLAHRAANGLLGGMWEFPNGPVRSVSARNMETVLHKLYQLDVRCGERLTVIDHAYSHFSVSVYAFLCQPISVPKTKMFRWVRLGELNEFPMGRVDRRIARGLS